MMMMRRIQVGGMGLWGLVLVGILSFVRGEVYVVIVEGEPVVTYREGLQGYAATATESREELDFTSEHVRSYAFFLAENHNALLASVFEPGTYKKLYSYHHLINEYAVRMSPEQVRQRK